MTDSEFVQLITPAVLLALCLIIGKLFRDNRLSVPGILLLSIVIFYGWLALGGVSREEAASNGLLPSIESTGSLLPVFHWDNIQEIRWSAIFNELDGMVVVALLCSMMLLLDVSGIRRTNTLSLGTDKLILILQQFGA